MSRYRNDDINATDRAWDRIKEGACQAEEEKYQAAIKRIAEIDKMFEEATGWGSWMVECANEREALADKYNLPHKHLARNADGSRTD